MSVDFPDAQSVHEPALEVVAKTSVGQSQLAYRLAAVVLLTNVTLNLGISMATGTAAVPSIVLIDSALAVGLIDLRRGARALVLFRTVMGVIVGATFAVLPLVRGQQPSAALALGALSQLAYAATLALLLTGQSKSWRLALAMGVFVLGLACARLWEPFVGATVGQTADGTKVAIDVLLALAVAELVAATAIKQMAQEGWLSRLAMILLAIASIITMMWVAWLIGITEYGGVFVVTILWPVAAVIVLVQDRKRKKLLLYGLGVLGTAYWAVLLFLLFTSGGT